MGINFRTESFRDDFTFRNSPEHIRRFPFPFNEDKYMYAVNMEPHVPAGPPGHSYNELIDVDEHFSGATAAAVRRWQHAEGLSETGEVELGRVVFAPGARRVTTVHVSIGQDPPGNGANANNPSGSSSPSTGRTRP